MYGAVFHDVPVFAVTPRAYLIIIELLPEKGPVCELAERVASRRKTRLKLIS
jgi:hypothetical protein